MAPARSVVTLVALVLVLGGCSATTPSQKADGTHSMRDLVFLTRDGCVNTETMRANLDAALRVMGLPMDYQFIDADSLEESDPRGGYGTPTVLYSGRDLFGMAEPPVPHPSPT